MYLPYTIWLHRNIFDFKSEVIFVSHFGRLNPTDPKNEDLRLFSIPAPLSSRPKQAQNPRGPFTPSAGHVTRLDSHEWRSAPCVGVSLGIFNQMKCTVVVIEATPHDL